MTDATHTRFAAFFSALSHPTRIEIVTELLSREICVSDIQELTSLRQPNISQHLFYLRSHNIVDWHQRGNRKCYYLKNPRLIRSVLNALRKNETGMMPKKGETIRPRRPPDSPRAITGRRRKAVEIPASKNDRGG